MKPGLPLPPEGHDLGLDMIESQCAASCDPGRAQPCLTLSNRSPPALPFFCMPSKHLVKRGCSVMHDIVAPGVQPHPPNSATDQACGPMPQSRICKISCLPILSWNALLCADDDDLLTWTKQEAPIIEHPPQGEALTGFRDPYIIQRCGGGRPWKIAIGSGIKGSGGTILQYTSDHLLEGASSS